MNTALRLLAISAASSMILLAAGCSSSDDASSEAAGHITRAETYADQGQYRSAMLEVRNAVQKDPGNVEHVILLAGIYNDIGAGEQATELLAPWLEDQRQQVALPLARGYILQNKHLSAREALEGFTPQTDAEERQFQLLLAESKRLAGNTGEAISDLRSLQQSVPDSPQVTAALGKALLAAGESNAAINELTQWTSEHDENAEILYLTGLAHYRLGEVDETTEILTRATSSVPTSDIFLPVRQQILTLLSRSLTEQGRITEAQVYNKILAENTNSETRERAESAIEAITRGDLDTARTTLEELIRQNPETEQFALMLGALSLQEGRREEAKALLVDNIDAEVTPTPFIRAAIMAQIDGGKREEALQTLSRSIEARPNDSDLLAMHGLLALSLDDHKEAGIASLSKALELNRSRSRLRLALARHFIREGQTEQALAQMRVAFTETPTDWPVTRYYLGLLLSTDRQTEAGEIKESLLNGFAGEPRAITLAAMTEYRLGELDAARSRLERQVQDNPEDATALATLAMVYQSESNNQDAVSTLIKAALLSPDSIGPIQAAGQVYARDHSPDELVAWLEGVAEKHPELAVNSKALAAQVRVQQGKLSEARRLLESQAEDERSSIATTVEGQLLAAEAEAAADQDNWPEARARAAEVAALQPDSLRFALVPVSIFGMEGEHQKALDTLEELESVHGENATIDLMRARLLNSSEGQEAAWSYLQSRWQKSRDSQLIPVLVGLAKAQSPDDVDRLTRAWVEAQPESAAAHLSRAEYQMTNGDDSGAISSYETAIGYQPDNPIALNNLAWLLRERNREQALKLASQAQQLAPENAAILDTYGWILHLAGRHGDAKSVIEKALALSPDSEEIQDHLDEVNQAL